MIFYTPTYTLLQKCCDLTGGFVPLSVNQSLNGLLLMTIFVFVLWYAVVHRCSLILTLKLNNHTLNSNEQDFFFK